MNLFFKYFCTLFLSCLFCACGENENTSFVAIDENDLTQTFGKNKETAVVEVNANVDFSAMSDQAWCSAWVDNRQLTISVDKNNGSARSAQVSVIAKGVNPVIVRVSQQGQEDYATLIELPALFSDHMVLQRESEAAIWGTATAGKNIEIITSWNKRTYTVQTDAAGKWQTKVQTGQAGGPYSMTVSGNNKEIKLNNVMLGDVWICSGQSNMEMPVGRVPIYGFTFPAINNASHELAAANYSGIRLLQMKRVFNTQLSDKIETNATWQVCSNATIAGFSAVAYFFARNIYENQQIPIGLIQTAWGGTVAEAWVSEASLTTLSDFTNDIAKVKNMSAEEIARSQYPNFPTILYNAMIHPLVAYSIKGAIWYQGESNVGRAAQYKKLLPLLISDWRKAWGYDFPFYFVQLANYMTPNAQPTNSTWAELREAQLQTLQTEHTGMAVAIDIGDANDIHPGNKQDVGLRLALNARAYTYMENITPCGPLYESIAIEGNKIRVRFKMAGGLKTKDGSPIQGFAVAGADKVFRWAEAVIDGNDVMVGSELVNAPVAVRYAWANNPACNLCNSDNLPASPFRTDNW
jgi:sialate O-acetylesterase